MNEDGRRVLRTMPITTYVAAVGLIFLSGCSIGPQTVSRDRVSYGDALANSTREELLKNIVRVRYMESPVFLTISSVVNQYSLESTVSAGASWDWGSAAGTGNTVGASGKFSDRPTITYAPMVGKKFTETILRPIQPESLMSLVESGYRVDALFPLIVHSINGIRNSYYAGRSSQALDPRFREIVDLLSTMQQNGELSIRVEQAPDDSQPSFVVIIAPHESDEARQRVLELKSLLGMNPNLARYRIVFGAAPRDDSEIAMVTRSILTILGDMSSYVQVPEEDITLGRTRPGAPEDETVRRPLLVHCTDTDPEHAYVKVRHRDHWFWINDRDLESKRTFFALVLLTTLAESSEAAQAPLLTIPAG